MSSVDDSIGQGGDFQKGASNPNDPYNTSPTGLGIMPSYLGGARASSVSSNVSGTSSVGHGTKTSNVSTSATTFGTGADILASAVTFTADGTSDYLVAASGQYWLCTSSGLSQAAINLDGSEAGIIGNYVGGNQLTFNVAGLISAPSAGSHTVNIRVFTSAGTLTVAGGTGGTGATPIVVRVEALT